MPFISLVKISFQSCLWTNLPHVRGPSPHEFRRFFTSTTYSLFLLGFNRSVSSIVLFLSCSKVSNAERAEKWTKRDCRNAHYIYSSVVASKAYWIEFLMLNCEYYFFEKQAFSKRMRYCDMNINKYFSIWKNKILHSKYLIYFRRYLEKKRVKN